MKEIKEFQHQLMNLNMKEPSIVFQFLINVLKDMIKTERKIKDIFYL